jgi:hypothetical protein
VPEGRPGQHDPGDCIWCNNTPYSY